MTVEPVPASEESVFQHLMQTHHYLGAPPKIGHTIWHVATIDKQWLALLSFSAGALNCAARDAWIGWDYRHQSGRLNLVAKDLDHVSYRASATHWRHLPQSARRQSHHRENPAQGRVSNYLG
ncbi:MAG: DUF4338 domain-containing protein [Proteobacteria bacterium]|nr:DUF4338 domain-containing protein [Pseudomonadota bacterium]